MGIDTSESVSLLVDNSLVEKVGEISSYYGIKNIDNEELYESKTKEESGSEQDENKTESNLGKIPTTFEWDGNGKSVFLTGSFCNWNQFFKMDKNEDGKFRFTLQLPRGKYQYKFKVDNSWEFSQNYPTIKDNVYINNIIDTTNWEIPLDENNQLSEKDISKKKSQTSTKEKCNSRLFYTIEYSNDIPDRKSFGKSILSLPDLYKFNNKSNSNLDINQNKICKNKDSSSKENNLLSNDFTYKKTNVQHERINHLNINQINNENNNIIKSFVTSRCRLKFTTIIYYKPKNNKYTCLNDIE